MLQSNFQFYLPISLFYHRTEIRCSNFRKWSRKVQAFTFLVKYQLFWSVDLRWNQGPAPKFLNLNFGSKSCQFASVIDAEVVFRLDNFVTNIKKELSLLVLLDLFSYWNLIIATNYYMSQASGTVQIRFLGSDHEPQTLRRLKK